LTAPVPGHVRRPLGREGPGEVGHRGVRRDGPAGAPAGGVGGAVSAGGAGRHDRPAPRGGLRSGEVDHLGDPGHRHDRPGHRLQRWHIGRSGERWGRLGCQGGGVSDPAPARCDAWLWPGPNAGAGGSCGLGRRPRCCSSIRSAWSLRCRRYLAARSRWLSFAGSSPGRHASSPPHPTTTPARPSPPAVSHDNTRRPEDDAEGRGGKPECVFHTIKEGSHDGLAQLLCQRPE
jgi:hypothetical protein